VRRAVSGLGRVLVTGGLLVLIFAAYQLWGTGVYTARAQDSLRQEFEAARASTRTPTPPSTRPSATTPATVAPTTTTTTPPPAPPPAESDVVAHLVIPRIGVDTYVVQGTATADLRRGPGHYAATPLPGQLGNAAIAGHRTTYGAPFGELDVLEAGDQIRVTTLQGSFEYRVFEKIVVAPDASEVLDPDPLRNAILTLTTCHPKYSAAERLIIKGELVIPPGQVALPPTIDTTQRANLRAEARDVLTGEPQPVLPTVLAGLLAAIVGGLWWLLFHRHPRWTTWVIGAVPFAVALGYFYVLLERSLPANY
jgi:sortase A